MKTTLIEPKLLAQAKRCIRDEIAQPYHGRLADPDYQAAEWRLAQVRPELANDTISDAIQEANSELGEPL